MTAAAERTHSSYSVAMVRNGNDNGVEPWMVEQAAEIIVGFGLGKLLGGNSEMLIVDVTEGDNVLTGDIGEIVIALIGNPDDAEIEFLVGRSRPAVARHERHAQDRKTAKELAAGEYRIHRC